MDDPKPSPPTGTNTPLTGTQVLPGKSLGPGPIGSLNSRVVAPYPNQNLGPMRPPVAAPPSTPVKPEAPIPVAKQGPAPQNADINKRPAIMGDAAKKPASQPAPAPKK